MAKTPPPENPSEYYITGGPKPRGSQLETDQAYVDAVLPGMQTKPFHEANLSTLQRVSQEGRTAALIHRFPSGTKSGL